VACGDRSIRRERVSAGIKLEDWRIETAADKFVTHDASRCKQLSSNESGRLPLMVVCHEYRRSIRRYATVREMKEDPSSSAIRC
jgi:hypothetical protein